MAMRAYDLDGQHERLRIDLDRLRLVLLAPADALPEARMLLVLQREAQELSNSLEYHFEFEESGGYMAEVLRARPGLARRVEELRRQHTDLLQRMKAAAQAGQTLVEVRHQLTAALDAIGDHEGDEVSILQDVLNTDLGEGN
jgi:hypothetical protein